MSSFHCTYVGRVKGKNKIAFCEHLVAILPIERLWLLHNFFPVTFRGAQIMELLY